MFPLYFLKSPKRKWVRGKSVLKSVTVTFYIFPEAFITMANNWDNKTIFRASNEDRIGIFVIENKQT